MSKQLQMHNGEVRESVPVCHHCQQPGAEIRAITGESYHPDCLPDTLRRY